MGVQHTVGAVRNAGEPVQRQLHMRAVLQQPERHEKAGRGRASLGVPAAGQRSAIDNEVGAIRPLRLRVFCTLVKMILAAANGSGADEPLPAEKSSCGLTILGGLD